MKNFTIIPNELLEASQLTVSEKYLMCVLLKYCGRNDSCFPSQTTLAKDLNRSARQIRNMLEHIIEAGLIVKVRRGWNRSNTYEVTKRFTINKNLTTPLIGSTFPLHQGDKLPTKNTYLTGKDKRSSKGHERLREDLKKKLLIR